MTRKEMFDRLAHAQRGEPEDAMGRIQHSQVSQLYGNLAEHVGDLTHRMSEHSEVPHFYHGYPYVHEKVTKTLRWLRHPYGFRREVEEQARMNYDHYLERGRLEPWYTSPEAGLAHLRALGKEYADAHRGLPVFNDVQRTARDAAVAVGEFRFSDAERLLARIEGLLARGPEAWMAEAGKAPAGTPDLGAARGRRLGVAREIPKTPDGHRWFDEMYAIYADMTGDEFVDWMERELEDDRTWRRVVGKLAWSDRNSEYNLDPAILETRADREGVRVDERTVAADLESMLLGMRPAQPEAG